MSKPQTRKRSCAAIDLANFTDRDEQRKLFRSHLFSPKDVPVLVFYGVGGTGKTWLLSSLRAEVPTQIPTAFLDFDRIGGGRRFVFDPTTALYEIREQFGMPTPRFDLAFGILRVKQGASEEAGLLTDVGSEVLTEVAKAAMASTHAAPLVQALPGAVPLLKSLSKSVQRRLRGSPLEEFLARSDSQRFVLSLRTKKPQELASELMGLLASDLRTSLETHLNRAVSAVLFFDTFEAIGSEMQSGVHSWEYEQWIRDLASTFDFGMLVIAGQNKLTWDEVDPSWRPYLEQHVIGGLSDADARSYLDSRGIVGCDIQEAIVNITRVEGEGCHCLTLGLCADTVGHGFTDVFADLTVLSATDRAELAVRFFKSLKSDAERRWIERLALAPRFDEEAARKAFSSDHSAAQEAAWEALLNYSFIVRSPGTEGWLAINGQMRRALKTRPNTEDRLSRDHVWWKEYWGARSITRFDLPASLAWYHHFCISPNSAIDIWVALAKESRTSIPSQMSDHFHLLQWLESIDLMDTTIDPLDMAKVLVAVSDELEAATLGDRASNLRRASDRLERALRVYTENTFPVEWARIQGSLGKAWHSMPTPGRGAHLLRAMECYHKALRIYTPENFPLEWARTQNRLGEAWRLLPTGNVADNLRLAIDYYSNALSVFTEQQYPDDWAAVQNNLGIAFAMMPIGSREENVRTAIGFLEGALRAYTEESFPLEWAAAQCNLGGLLIGRSSGEDSEAVNHLTAALRVYTEENFPQNWAAIQDNLGTAILSQKINNSLDNHLSALRHYEAALRVRTEEALPVEWATTQHNLGRVWSDMAHVRQDLALRHAIKHYKLALHVFTEQEFPLSWASTQNNLGTAWARLRGGNRRANLVEAVACFRLALRVHTEDEFPNDYSVDRENLSQAEADIERL